MHAFGRHGLLADYLQGRHVLGIRGAEQGRAQEKLGVGGRGIRVWLLSLPEGARWDRMQEHRVRIAFLGYV